MSDFFIIFVVGKHNEYDYNTGIFSLDSYRKNYISYYRFCYILYN